LELILYSVQHLLHAVLPNLYPKSKFRHGPHLKTAFHNRFPKLALSCQSFHKSEIINKNLFFFLEPQLRVFSDFGIRMQILTVIRRVDIGSSRNIPTVNCRHYFTQICLIVYLHHFSYKFFIFKIIKYLQDLLLYLSKASFFLQMFLELTIILFL
jgi:hypothetical protein